ncbi:ARM repeat-containing protein [Auricularia subglabra TFB-10046 SS5]|nr:ARM repeat-containing protein [Auricularia subglabra TFB-10046 SS5]
MATDSQHHSNTANSDYSDRGMTPPAFLDLADSAARLGSNLPDVAARIELKRLEHERQKQFHRKNFEEQMRMLEAKQALEERQLLTANVANDAASHAAVSAPTTPPRQPGQLNASPDAGRHDAHHFDHSALAQVASKASKRKSVTYAPSLIQDAAPAYGGSLHPHSFARPVGAKSMPASRRTSASSQELDELSDLTLKALALHDRSVTPISSSGNHSILRNGRGEEAVLRTEPQSIDAGLMLDEQLDKEIHNTMQDAMRYFPVGNEEEKFPLTRTESYPGRLSASSAALDLAPLSGTPPRNSYLGRANENNAGKSSEWPQFPGRTPEGYPARPEKHRTATTPVGLGTLNTASKMIGALSASATPNMAQISPDVSRRSSPPGLSDGLSITTARSVPATPLTGLPNGRPDVSNLIKTPGTPLAHGTGASDLASQYGATGQISDRNFSANDLTATLSRLGNSSPYDAAGYGSMQHSPGDQEHYGVDSLYNGLNSGYDSGRFGANGAAYGANNFDQGARAPAGAGVAGSTALYHHHGTRYGLSHGTINNRMVGGADSKMNGLHGPKHKRSDLDREFNRFAGTRLEDLQGEIASLCKDQHGCRYLQKKLEEGVPEHRDIIFHETFGHFAELMTDPFGNYLCQKLVEFSSDEQRNVICESVAQDLVTISLNMHGTRAVQKMIDFLSTPRQIHAIIVALSLHVVTLIKDLNGNHVIQKCLNKLVPEDNQFIYNAVAQNCVEVATHRHGCCVLQRCIDHASDSQRVQLVQEITYNALTLVQDPYGNYVVQYILDLNDNRFSDGVIRQFSGNVCALSVQKFSSNVIEKCVRVAEPHTRKLLIDELLHRNRLEKLLRDSFGNYCVQTALDYAEPTQRALLVEGIRPILPMIRNTPYGKRIQSKLQREAMDTHGGHYGGYQGQLLSGAAGYGANGSHAQARHLSQAGIHHSHQLSDLYGAQSSLYSNGLHQAALATPQVHTSQLHSLAHPSIDPYILQNAGLGQGLGANGGFSSFAANSFGSSINIGESQYGRPGYHYAM